MSRFGTLVCFDCKQTIWLGKIVIDEENGNFFHIGEASQPRNWERPELTRSVWKFLANHINHSMLVTIDYEEPSEEIYEFTEIGGDGIGDIRFQDYLEGWRG